jgi:hypothetical protein
MKSDVKAVRVTGTGAVFAGRTRLRGLILASDGVGAGTIILQDNTDSTTQLYFKETVQQEMFLHLTFQKMVYFFQVE